MELKNGDLLSGGDDGSLQRWKDGKALGEKIEQIVRLIRSKGVGVYFVTQSPLDVPEPVLAQLGNRVQHALRAYTPRETRAVKAAAGTFRPNPAFSAFEVITQLGVGEALVSTLEDKGAPSVVQRTLIRPPASRIGTITEAERRAVIAASPVGPVYDTPVDRHSAYEILAASVSAKVSGDAAPAPDVPPEAEGGGGIGGLLGSVFGTDRPRGRRLTTTQTVARSVTRTVTTQVVGGLAAQIGRSVGGSTGASSGGALVRGLLGGLLRG